MQSSSPPTLIPQPDLIRSPYKNVYEVCFETWSLLRNHKLCATGASVVTRSWPMASGFQSGRSLEAPPCRSCVATQTLQVNNRGVSAFPIMLNTSASTTPLAFIVVLLSTAALHPARSPFARFLVFCYGKNLDLHWLHIAAERPPLLLQSPRWLPSSLLGSLPF